MEQYTNSIIAVLLFVIIIFVYSQIKFKNKMLCYFLRPNKQRIKKWVPLFTNHVIFDKGKYGFQRYKVNPKCIVMEWYTGGISKIFPVLVPTLDFRWDSPNPVDPETSQGSWHTPEVEAAAYQGQSYVGLSKAMAAQVGGKRNKILEIIPLIILGLVVIIGFIVYTGMANLSGQVGGLQQQIDLLK